MSKKEYGSNEESLKKNHSYYSDNRQFLIQTYYGRFIIVHNGMYDSDYKSRGEAMDYCDYNLPVDECIILKIDEIRDLVFFGDDDIHEKIMSFSF